MMRIIPPTTRARKMSLFTVLMWLSWRISRKRGKLRLCLSRHVMSRVVRDRRGAFSRGDSPARGGDRRGVEIGDVVKDERLDRANRPLVLSTNGTVFDFGMHGKICDCWISSSGVIKCPIAPKGDGVKPYPPAATRRGSVRQRGSRK